MPEARRMPEERNRIVSGKASDEDARIEASVRPASFGDYIGQDRVKENLQIAVEAARGRGGRRDWGACTLNPAARIITDAPFPLHSGVIGSR